MRKYAIHLVLIALCVYRIYNFYVISPQTTKHDNKGIGQTLLVKLVNFVDEYRSSLYTYVSSSVMSVIPSPHSELILGLTLGYDNLAKDLKFKDSLKRTGTMHVVVVSGFNITLVLNAISKIVGSKYQKRNFLIIYSFLFLYSVLTGFNPPVVRAFIMSFVNGFALYSGRKITLFQILIFSSIFMLTLHPAYITSLSFILSFTATLGLFLYCDYFKNLFVFLHIYKLPLIEDLSTSLAAQVLVWPIISYYFGQVSIISPVTNMLSLWTIPISTILGFIQVISAVFPHMVAVASSLLIFPFLDIFVVVVGYFAQLPYAVVDFKLSGLALCIYYSCLFVLTILVNMQKNKVASSL